MADESQQMEYSYLQALVHKAITADGFDPKTDDLDKMLGTVDLRMLNGKNRNWGMVINHYKWGTVLRLYYFTFAEAVLRTTLSWDGVEFRFQGSESGELAFNLSGNIFTPRQLIDWRMSIINPLSRYAGITPKRIFECRAKNLMSTQNAQDAQFTRFSPNHKWMLISSSVFDPTIFLFRCRRGDLVPELVVKHTLATNHYLDWCETFHPIDPIVPEARLCSWERTTITAAGRGQEKLQKTLDLDDDSDSRLDFLPLDSHSLMRQAWFDATVSNRDVQKLVWNYLFFFTDF